MLETKEQVKRIQLVLKVLAILFLLILSLALVTVDKSDEELTEEAKQQQRDRITHLVNTDPTYKDFYSKPPKRSYPWD